MRCGVCNGRGSIGFTACSTCKGQGELPDDPKRTKTCGVCQGQGAIGFSVCGVCGGYGLIVPLNPTPDQTAPLCFFVETGKPRTAHLRLDNLFESLTGHLRICDPYYGTGSLYRLDLLKHCSPIQFLTSKADGAEATILPRAISEWKREHGATEFRKDTSGSLHDRYVLTDDEIIFLGHGLKDVGNKDSFVIRLPKSLASDVMDSTRTAFDLKWATAAII